MPKYASAAIDVILENVLPEFILDNLDEFVEIVRHGDWYIAIMDINGVMVSICADEEELIMYVLEDWMTSPVEVFEGCICEDHELREVLYSYAFNVLDRD